jgi:hypothetical protein
VELTQSPVMNDTSSASGDSATSTASTTQGG